MEKRSPRDGQGSAQVGPAAVPLDQQSFCSFTLLFFPNPLKELSSVSYFFKIYFSIYLLIYFCLFRATPMAYGSSQAKEQIGAIAAGLNHSHGNVGSESCL